MKRGTANQIEQRRYEQAVQNRRSYHLEPLGSAFVAALRAGPAPEDMAAVERAWRDVTPESLRSASRVETFEAGVLRITVADPVTRFSLIAQRRALLSRLKRHLPGVRSLRVGLEENGFGKRQNG